jgi:hypothetical protein
MFADKTRYMISDFSEKEIVPDSCLTYDDQLHFSYFTALVPAKRLLCSFDRKRCPGPPIIRRSQYRTQSNTRFQ